MTKNEKIKTIVENLNVFRSRSDISREQISISLSHLASTLCDAHKESSPQELDAMYKKLVPDSFGSEKIILYKEMIKRPALHSKMRSEFAIGSDLTPAGAHAKISYVKNDLNQVAFELFSQKINSAKPIWETNFSQSCENVSNGNSEFCILPIESSSDGKLLGFYSMIEKYDLKIVSVCEVDDAQGEPVRYALISKSCPSFFDTRGDNEVVFEFSVLSQNCEFLPELLSAAEACGACAEKICFVPVKYDSNLFRYIMSFRLPSNDVLPLRAFLALSYHSYTPIGCYTDNNIKEN